MPQSRTRKTWHAMLDRCHKETHFAYAQYGARGITVCEEWRESFDCFLSEMGDQPDGLTLERRDNEAGYCKANCIWATRKDQARNTRQTRFIEWGGAKRPLAAITDWLGISKQMVLKRLNKGMPLEVALFLPSQRYVKGPRRRGDV